MIYTREPVGGGFNDKRSITAAAVGDGSMVRLDATELDDFYFLFRSEGTEGLPQVAAVRSFPTLAMFCLQMLRVVHNDLGSRCGAYSPVRPHRRDVQAGCPNSAYVARLYL